MQIHVSWWYSFMPSRNIHSKVTLLMFTISKIWKYKGNLPWYKMWNTLKHRNDYICTILINPILIINQFFLWQILLFIWKYLWWILLFIYEQVLFRLFYYVFIVLFYFSEKLYIFENIFYVYNCKSKYVLHIDICIPNTNTCTSVFDVVDFKQVLYYAIGKHVHVWNLFFITWRRLLMKQKFIDLFLVLVNQFSFIQTWYISMPSFHRSMYTF